jgi:hypothetical protein
MRMDQLTVKAAEAVQAAHERASSAGHAQLEPLHLLLTCSSQIRATGVSSYPHRQGWSPSGSAARNRGA